MVSDCFLSILGTTTRAGWGDSSNQEIKILSTFISREGPANTHANNIPSGGALVP